MDFEEELIAGLHEGLLNWSQSEGALTVARNGGAEFALRAHLLPFLEKATKYLAFTEAEGKRFDVTLCPRDTSRMEVVLLEFKHNFLHQSLVTIQAERENAVQKLRGATSTRKCITGRYYMHFVVELAVSALDGPNDLMTAHNNLVGTRSYKRFMPLEEMAKVRKTAWKQLKGKPASYVISSTEEWQVTAILHCWLAAVPRSGTKVSYLGLPGYRGRRAHA